MIKSISEFFKGKKTYITAITTAILTGLEVAGVSIPMEVYQILAAFGLYAVRSAIATSK